MNFLSDSVSVVSLSERRVIDTIYVEDEPADVVFAGGKAFISVAASNEVRVFDALTRAPLGVIPIEGKDPRALVASADGSEVFALVRTSGNRTTLVPAGAAPPQPDPDNPALPPPPKVGLIVSQDDPAWSSFFTWSLEDFDLARIDVATESVLDYTRTIGTINLDLALHPTTGEIFVANTDARNTIRFEPELRGHAIDSRVTRVSAGGATTVFDLNPGIDYRTLPNDAARAIALAEPTGIVVDPLTNTLYIAAHGTDRVGVMTTSGSILDRIEIGNTPGAAIDTRAKRGPRGLALLPSEERPLCPEPPFAVDFRRGHRPADRVA